MTLPNLKSPPPLAFRALRNVKKIGLTRRTTMCDQCVTKCDQLTLFMKFLKHLLLFINFLYVLLQIIIIIPTFKPIFVTSRRTSSHMKLFHVRRVYTLLYVVYPYLIPISIITQPIEYTIIRVEGFHTFTIKFYTFTIIKSDLYFLARI